MKNEIPCEISLWALNSICGEITENMRMVAFFFDGNRANFRFYMSTVPTEIEKEIGEIVAVNFDSGLSLTLDSLDIEFIVSNAPVGKLEPLDLVLFCRWEPTSDI